MMRLIFVLVLLAGLMVIGCDSGNETAPLPTPTATVTESDISDIPDITPIGMTPNPDVTRDESDETLFSEEGPLSVQLTADKLTITNNSPEVVYYYVWPVNIVGLIDWYPCENPEQCADYPSIESGQSAKRGIVANETDLIVYWWQLIHHPDGTTSAGSAHEVLIEIP